MDIKNKYPPSPPKGTSSAVDSKRNQDACPKALRKREATGTNNFPRNEQPRKYNIQKNTVKRPRAKGQYHGGAEENTKVVEAKRAEPGSVLVHRNKKENGNHLLNFHYELTNAQSRNTGKATKKFGHNGNRSLPPVQRHKYNKEHFLQASCQFIVTANGDYSLYLNNPDVLVDWKLIEQIRIRSSESIVCPICLYAPVAGKITRCGHIYCWSCILRNIDVNGINTIWCKCPICYDAVNKKDLKSMVEITQNTYNLGDILTLRLMRREKDSIFGMPVGSETHTPTTFLSISENSTNKMYSKLLIANVEDIMDIVEIERKQLKHELEVDPKNCYIEKALDELSQRENNLLLEITEAQDVPPMENVTVEEIAKHVIQNEVNTDAICKNNAKPLAEYSPKTVDNASSKSQSASGSSKFIYYYQAKDGQHLYLHAVNVKMLERQYGSLEKCPFEITGRLLEKEVGSCTEDLRRRLRYLRHLPLACPFEIAEIELKPPLVSMDVLHLFNDQLNSRRKHRKRRESEERKRERNIQKKQNERMGKYPMLDVNIDSRQHFPEWKPELLFEEHPPLSPELTTISDIAGGSFSSASDGIAAETDYSHEQQQQQQVPSFAEMLCNKQTHGKPIRVPPPLSVQSRTYAATTRTCSPPCQSNDRQQSNEDEGDVEEAYYTSPPLNNQCLGDALSRALEQSKLLDMGTNVDDAIGKKRKKPKKRRKETVLFATTMSRGS